MPNVVLIGHVCIDHNKSEHAEYESWGSSVLYMAQVLQRQYGLSPLVVSSYGPDILPYLPGVTMLPTHPNQKETLIYENDSTRTRRIQTCYNLHAALPPAITSDIEDVLGQADIFVIATLLPNYSAEYLKDLLSHASPRALKVLCPQGYFRHIADNGRVEPRDFTEAASIIPLFDLVVYSEEDHPGAFECAKEWKQSTSTEIIITQSSNGATIIGKNDSIHIPTKPIPPEKIVDSVGCGDTFAAALTFAYYESKDLTQAINKAHKVAAQKLLAVATLTQPAQEVDQ